MNLADQGRSIDVLWMTSQLTTALYVSIASPAGSGTSQIHYKSVAPRFGCVVDVTASQRLHTRYYFKNNIQN